MHSGCDRFNCWLSSDFNVFLVEIISKYQFKVCSESAVLIFNPSTNNAAMVCALTCGRLFDSMKTMREEHKNEAAAERRSPKTLICCFSLLAHNAHPSGLTSRLINLAIMI